MSKTALITGASRGIGYETAKRLLLEDSKFSCLILFARESEEFKNVLKEFDELNVSQKKIVHRFVDVGDLQALETAVHSVYQLVGNIHLLVNNAGYTNPVPIQQVSLQDFKKTLSVNLYAPFVLVQELLHLGNQFDVIVNIASTAGINGRSGWLTYSASKAALINMSQVMREELSIYETRVVCISPGRTATSLRKILAPDEDPATIMQPSHVAEVIATLVSETGKYIDSENIVVRL